MDTPVDVFEPAVMVLASNEDLIVRPTETDTEFCLENTDGQSENIVIDVGSLIKVVVGPASIAFLGTKALQLFNKDSKSIQTFANNKLFVDITWESNWYLASKSDKIETYKLIGTPELVGSTSLNGEYMEFRDGHFYGTAKVCGVTLTEQSISNGLVTFNAHEPIRCIASSGDLVAFGLKKRIIVLHRESYHEIPVRNTVLSLTFFGDILYFCHQNGVSEVEYDGLKSQEVISEPPDGSSFKGNICGFATNTLESASQVVSDSEYISLARHQQTVADLQAQISKLKSQLSRYEEEDEPIVPSTTIDTEFEKVDFPTSISDAFSRLFGGQDLYYYFDIKQNELSEYFAGTDAVRAQLLKLTLINDFPSSVLADRLVKELGPVVAPPEVFEAVIKKYHVYEQYKSG